MIINFNELTIPFYRLAPGAVLISPDDTRYLKCTAIDWEYCWLTYFDVACESSMTDKQMAAMIGNGEGWKVLP